MTEYIKTIRKKVEHDPVMQCGASVIVVNGQGDVLLQHRADEDAWGYHGGAVELGEDVEAAACRELQEETGLIAGKMTLLGVFSGEGMHHIYPNGDEVYNVDIVYICDDYSGSICPQQGEVTELGWFAQDQLPSNLFGPNKRAMAAFLQKGRQDNG